MARNNPSPPASDRLEPYRGFKFRVKWDGKSVAGVSKVSPLKRTTDVITHRSGGDPTMPHHMPGLSDYAAITLERGVTHDVDFEQWATKVWDEPNSTSDDRREDAGEDLSLKDFRKDLVLEVYNEAGQKVMAYRIYRCWPSEFSALPELNSTGNAVAIQRLVIENEGWERDTSVAGPDEPSYSPPS